MLLLSVDFPLSALGMGISQNNKKQNLFDGHSKIFKGSLNTLRNTHIKKELGAFMIVTTADVMFLLMRCLSG